MVGEGAQPAGVLVGRGRAEGFGCIPAPHDGVVLPGHQARRGQVVGVHVMQHHREVVASSRSGVLQHAGGQVVQVDRFVDDIAPGVVFTQQLAFLVVDEVGLAGGCGTAGTGFAGSLAKSVVGVGDGAATNEGGCKPAPVAVAEAEGAVADDVAIADGRRLIASE